MDLYSDVPFLLSYYPSITYVLRPSFMRHRLREESYECPTPFNDRTLPTHYDYSYDERSR